MIKYSQNDQNRVRVPNFKIDNTSNAVIYHNTTVSQKLWNEYQILINLLDSYFLLKILLVFSILKL